MIILYIKIRKDFTKTRLDALLYYIWKKETYKSYDFFDLSIILKNIFCYVHFIVRFFLLLQQTLELNFFNFSKIFKSNF